MSFNTNISSTTNSNYLSQWLSSFLEEAEEASFQPNEEPLSCQSSSSDLRASSKRTRKDENIPNTFSALPSKTFYPPETSSSIPSLDLLSEPASLKNPPPPAFSYSAQPSPKRRRIEPVSSEAPQLKIVPPLEPLPTLSSIYSLDPSLNPNRLSLAKAPQPPPLKNSLASALPYSQPFNQRQETIGHIFSQTQPTKGFYPFRPSSESASMTPSLNQTPISLSPPTYSASFRNAPEPAFILCSQEQARMRRIFNQAQPPVGFYPSKSSSASASIASSLPRDTYSRTSLSSSLTRSENLEKLEENFKEIELASDHPPRDFFKIADERLKATYAEKIHCNFLNKVNHYSFHFLPNDYNLGHNQKIINKDSTKQILHPKYIPIMEQVHKKMINFEIEVTNEFDAKNPDCLKKLAYVISHHPDEKQPKEIFPLEDIAKYIEIIKFQKNGNIVRGTLDFMIDGYKIFTSKTKLFHSFYFGGHCFSERAIVLNDIFKVNKEIPITYSGMKKALVSYTTNPGKIADKWKKRKCISPIYFPSQKEPSNDGFFGL